jgi:predicted DNA-binding transcriptional regulator AlpA
MERHYTWQELHDLGIAPSRQHTRRLIACDIFPKPVRLGDPMRGRLAWPESRVEAYLARKALESEQPRPRRQPKVVSLTPPADPREPNARDRPKGRRKAARPCDPTSAMPTTTPQATNSAAAGKGKGGKQRSPFEPKDGSDDPEKR